ncbi:S1C family serine protease [Deinococcus sp.]|uniref:S1C family serine protease n=1 Tax=Deinococcus sp. TaxID=47478 RepID=UPI0025C659B0|nr:S1C family serine protease [Deinococcus sp.]
MNLTAVRQGLLLFLAGHSGVHAGAAPPSRFYPGPLLVDSGPAAPLSAQDYTDLQALFGRVRPATLRIEQCPVSGCAEPGGVGSAVLIGPGGLALTAYHVVFQAPALSAMTSNRRRYAVKVIGYDDQNDLALLRVNVPAETPFLPLTEASPGVGEPVLVIGNGGGEYLRPKMGRLLALGAQAGRADFPPGTMELSAPLVPGDSGGPVLNRAGELSGVVSFIRDSPGDGSPNGVPGKDAGANITAYAVPMTAHDQRLAALRRGVKRDAPIIGVSLSGNLAVLSDLPAKQFVALTEQLGLHLGQTPGAFFNLVVPGSPAARARLQALLYDRNNTRIQGDIVTAVNGKRTVNFSEFQYAVRSYAPGEIVKLTVLRGGKKLTLKLKLVGRSTVKN